MEEVTGLVVLRTSIGALCIVSGRSALLPRFLSLILVIETFNYETIHLQTVHEPSPPQDGT
ncbi:hypothetical protein M408DRAFT_334246 [Serendipita vermifera MAFF 305830]|uniref:Uncharacterized protein n=1 Tax=Serendipita vermifera MAFF 305830 TaxID=933852 RepID=A0A0C3AIA9_SERVB|nr:hypothetical protein M408DRAFT_334246 [Serendipita vermifera MAFF 305830]